MVWISVVVAVGCGLLVGLLVMPFLYKAVLAQDEERQR
jgi:hypothetical protein